MDNLPKPSQRTIPLSEVAFGVNFVSPDFSSVKFGEFYARIKNRYPSHRDILPIINPTPMPAFVLAPQLPRVWFEKSDRLIQLQSDRFVYNWRLLNEEKNEYPGYEQLSAEFFQEYEEFSDFSTSSLNSPMYLEEFNLTYVNHLERADGLHGSTFTFYNQSWEKNFTAPQYVSGQLVFSFEDKNVRLTMSLRPVIKIGSAQAITQFELVAQSISLKNAIRSPAKEWYDQAHNIIFTAWRNSINIDLINTWGIEA